jgi:glutathione synthase/RimK-type ligase-like ATP-grasp enzyme
MGDSGSGLRIAMHLDNTPLSSGRSQSFASRWRELAAQRGIEVREVDAFHQGLLASLQDCDGFMWCFWNAPHNNELGRRLAMVMAHARHLPMFPDWKTCWFFEDKHAQRYLLEAADVPMPGTWVFWDEKAAHEFLESARYPLVVKLAFGIVSANVRLVRGPVEARNLVRMLFDQGLSTLPAQLGSGPAVWLRRRASNTLRAIRGQRPREHLGIGPVQKGVVMFQEFLDGNAFDYRITVIGERAFGFRRFNRPGDFRASGSGSIDWNPDDIEPEVVELAFATAIKLQSQVLALDILRRDGDLVVIEISYYYEAWAVHRCPGHWRRRADGPGLAWVSGQMRPEDAIFDDFTHSLLRPTAADSTSPQAPR